MLWNFILDGVNAFRLRFKPLEEYRYHWSTLVGIMLLLGLQKYLVFYVLIGISPALLLYCIIGIFLHCAILAETMKRVLKITQNRDISLFSFILLTEALLLPLVLLLFLPQDSPLQFLKLFFSLWFFVVQVVGLVWHSKATVLKVLVGYLLYAVIVFMALLTLLTIFHQLGGISSEEMQTIMDSFQAMQDKKS